MIYRAWSRRYGYIEWYFGRGEIVIQLNQWLFGFNFYRDQGASVFFGPVRISIYFYYF